MGRGSGAVLLGGTLVARAGCILRAPIPVLVVAVLVVVVVVFFAVIAGAFGTVKPVILRASPVLFAATFGAFLDGRSGRFGWLSSEMAANLRGGFCSSSSVAALRLRVVIIALEDGEASGGVGKSLAGGGEE